MSIADLATKVRLSIVSVCFIEVREDHCSVIWLRRQAILALINAELTITRNQTLETIAFDIQKQFTSKIVDQFFFAINMVIQQCWTMFYQHVASDAQHPNSIRL